MAHATLGAIGKSGPDPIITRGAINVVYSLVALPFVAFVFPLPTVEVFTVIAAAYFTHLVYEWFQARSYTIGAFTLVYPIARGIGPLAIAVASLFIFSESLESVQWIGLFLLCGSIFLFAYANYRHAVRVDEPTENLKGAIRAAVFCGLMIAVYTLVDAYGIRLSQNPLGFLFWIFFVGGFGFPLVAWRHWKRLELKPDTTGLWPRAVAGAAAAYLSFGSLMLATRLGSVTETAAIRETSIIFATAIGIFFFRERVTWIAVALVVLIALGATLVKTG